MNLNDTYFEKVSWEQFKKDCETNKIDIPTDKLKKFYSKIKLPERSTIGSAGYDFFIPFDTDFPQLKSVVIPTGIRCHIDDGWFLSLYSRSGIGFKTGMHMANLLPVIDSDYYNADNEGHIMVKIINDSILAKDHYIRHGQAFCQGIFLPYGITHDDKSIGVRTGGFGSTDSELWKNVSLVYLDSCLDSWVLI